MPCVWFISELQRLIRKNWTRMSMKVLGACEPEKRSKDRGRFLWLAGAWDALLGPDCPWHGGLWHSTARRSSSRAPCVPCSSRGLRSACARTGAAFAEVRPELGSGFQPAADTNAGALSTRCAHSKFKCFWNLNHSIFHLPVCATGVSSFCSLGLHLNWCLSSLI